MFNKDIHRVFFLLGTILVIVSIPFSPFLLSLGQFILAGNWIIEFDFKRKLKIFKERKSILLFISIYFIHVVWLFNSSDFSYALHDLKIKLPLLILPVIYGTSPTLNKKEIRTILHFFIASTFVATLVSVVIYSGITPIDPIDNRNISPVISHIRLALYIVLAIYVLISFLICNTSYKLISSVYYIIMLIWMILFILFLGAFTGIIILFIIAPFALLFWLKNQDNKKYTYAGIFSVSILLILLIAYFSYALSRYSARNNVDIQKLETSTVNNNKYSHYLNNYDYENKDRVWIYICREELKSEWEKRSNIDYEGQDKKGQPVKVTLIRYLTSRGYKKDSMGISKLTDEDIKMIEEGFTNYIYKNKFSLYPRLYELFWEVDSYMRYGNPSGHSFTQRIEYIKNAIRVIKRHFWLGTGTGDVNDQIKWQYDHDNSVLDKKWQLRAHNQFVTLFLTFGIIGFILLIITLTISLLKEKSNVDFIAFAFLLIVMFSMFNEDTLETQAGVNFFALFYSIFIFGRKLPSRQK